MLGNERLRPDTESARLEDTIGRCVAIAGAPEHLPGGIAGTFEAVLADGSG